MAGLTGRDVAVGGRLRQRIEQGRRRFLGYLTEMNITCRGRLDREQEETTYTIVVEVRLRLRSRRGYGFGASSAFLWMITSGVVHFIRKHQVGPMCQLHLGLEIIKEWVLEAPSFEKVHESDRSRCNEAGG